MIVKVLYSICSLVLFSVVSGIFEAPTKGTTAYCYDMKCVTDSLATLAPYDPTIIAMMSYNFAEDSYLGLYLGALLELFDAPEMKFVAIVLQMPSDTADKLQSVVKFAEALPKKTIFIATEHGRTMNGMATMKVLKDLNVAPRVIYHLNHEQPWQVNYSADPMNHIFDSVEELTDQYARFPLVLRNYYYTPLLSTSHYLPVSAPFEGHIVQNTSSDLFRTSQTSRASQRRHRCHFRGRIDYSKYSPETHEHKLPTLLQSDELFPQAIERREIIRLAQLNRLGGCDASSSDISTHGAYENEEESSTQFRDVYSEYMAVLADTAFVLCPQGNSAETFRHTEAMEFGAIPIILAVTDPSRNYMHDAHWEGYPGPVLASWDQLEGFLHSMTDSKIDALQQRVRKWYAISKARKKKMLVQQLTHAFSDAGCAGGKCNRDIVANREGNSDIKRIISDLQFSDIPKGEYEYTTQSLLAMLIKQNARIQILERTVELLMVERGV